MYKLCITRIWSTFNRNIETFPIYLKLVGPGPTLMKIAGPCPDPSGPGQGWPQGQRAVALPLDSVLEPLASWVNSSSSLTKSGGSSPLEFPNSSNSSSLCLAQTPENTHFRSWCTWCMWRMLPWCCHKVMYYTKWIYTSLDCCLCLLFLCVPLSVKTGHY